MLGDPNIHRAYALRCAELARSARTPEVRQHFLDLLMSWNRLVADLEGAGAFLDVMAAFEPESPDNIRSDHQADE
jgi:hypothetical protein